VTGVQTCALPISGKELIEQFSTQLHVNQSTPAAFIVHAANDQSVSVRNSLMFYEALIEKKIAASIHVFPSGGHAIALRNNPGSTELWTVLCEQWMKEIEFIK
jgi:dipeptidyl aminopeptidase/acylaminoacyl peptidase